MSKQTEKIKKLEVGKYYQDENKNIYIRVDKEIEGEPWGSTIELWENSITIQTDYPLAKYIYSDEVKFCHNGRATGKAKSVFHCKTKGLKFSTISIKF